MSKRTSYQLITLVVGLAALALGVAAIILRDWSTIEYVDGTQQLHYGPIQQCSTSNYGEEPMTTCYHISDFPAITKKHTFMDEFQILVLVGVGGGFAGLAVFMIAFTCGLDPIATLGIGIMAVADVCFIAGLVLFILDDTVNYDYGDSAVKHYNTAFYLACASLGCSLGTGSVGKYAIDERRRRN